MTIGRIVFLIALIWVLAWITGSSASVSAPGAYVRVGKGKGKGCGGGRLRSYSQAATGMYGDFVATASPAGIPAGIPFSTF